METPTAIRIYDDGWREIFVYATGRIWARAIFPSTGASLKLPISALRQGKEVPFKPTRMAKRIRRNAKCFGNDSRAVKDALAALR